LSEELEINRENEGIIEFICEGGYGSEARIIVELRTRFPGIGGTIITQEGAVTALRKEFNISPKMGHKMFLRHTIIKKLEDYFYRKHVYNLAHIPRPLGSISSEGEKPYEAYLYEWTFGIDSFPWKGLDRDSSQRDIILHDWNAFVNSYQNIGIEMGNDVADAEDGRMSQNIIHQLYRMNTKNLEMNSLWKRIDFGYRSVGIDYEKLLKFLNKNREDLTRTLRIERYQMLKLAIEYLTKGKEKMKKIDVGRLDVLIGDYRHNTLQQYISGTSGLTERSTHFDERIESLI